MLLIFVNKYPNLESFSKYKEMIKKIIINEISLNGGISASNIKSSVLLRVLETRYFILLTIIFAMILLINKAKIKAKKINKNSSKDNPIISLFTI